MDAIGGNLSVQATMLEQAIKLQESTTLQMIAGAVASDTAKAGREQILSLLGIGSTINTSA